MTKVADCIECGISHSGWVRIGRLKRPLGAQILAKRGVRSIKKRHGMWHWHDYNSPYTGASDWVFGLNGRQLINKGGKP